MVFPAYKLTVADLIANLIPLGDLVSVYLKLYPVQILELNHEQMHTTVGFFPSNYVLWQN